MSWSWEAPLRTINRLIFDGYQYDDDVYPIRADDKLDIYIGSVRCVTADNIQKHDITHIISCVHLMQKPSYPSNVQVHHVNVWDLADADIKDYFFSSITFIDKALKEKGTVLVHCNAGRSRSASIILAYFIYKYGLSCDDALQKLRSKRPSANPNPGFISQLKEWEQFVKSLSHKSH